MKNTVYATVLGLGSVALSACSPLATYPPDNRVMNPAAVVNEPVPTLIVESIMYADRRYGTGDEFAIDLPAGSSGRLYERIITRLGKGHVLTVTGERAYYITKVRARGFDAEVDMFIPDADGGYGFATLSFRHDVFKGFVLVDTRWWKTGAQPPAVPNYVVAKPVGKEPSPVEQPVLAHD